MWIKEFNITPTTKSVAIKIKKMLFLTNKVIDVKYGQFFKDIFNGLK